MITQAHTANTLTYNLTLTVMHPDIVTVEGYTHKSMWNMTALMWKKSSTVPLST